MTSRKKREAMNITNHIHVRGEGDIHANDAWIVELHIASPDLYYNLIIKE